MNSIEELKRTPLEHEIKQGLSSSSKIILLCTIVLVVFLSFAMFFMWNYLQELSASPLVLGARKVTTASGASDLSCTCYLVGLADKSLYPYQDTVFYFNSTTIWDKGSPQYNPLEKLIINPIN